MIDKYIKTLQEAYKEVYQGTSIVQDKEKYKENIIQDEEVLLYKLYTILLSELSRSLTLELILLKEENDNLEKTLKTLQFPTKTIPFLPLTYYKLI